MQPAGPAPFWKPCPSACSLLPSHSNGTYNDNSIDLSRQCNFRRSSARQDRSDLVHNCGHLGAEQSRKQKNLTEEMVQEREEEKIWEPSWEPEYRQPGQAVSILRHGISFPRWKVDSYRKSGRAERQQITRQRFIIRPITVVASKLVQIWSVEATVNSGWHILKLLSVLQLADLFASMLYLSTSAIQMQDSLPSLI